MIQGVIQLCGGASGENENKERSIYINKWDRGSRTLRERRLDKT